MRLKPDDLPETVVGEIRNIIFKIGGAVGVNSISSTTVEAVNSLVTFGTPSASSTNITVAATFVSAGRDTIKLTANLDSGEKLIGTVRTRTIDPRGCPNPRDYN